MIYRVFLSLFMYEVTLNWICCKEINIPVLFCKYALRKVQQKIHNEAAVFIEKSPN